MSFDDWYEDAKIEGIALFVEVDKSTARFCYEAGRAEQREVDAELAENYKRIPSYDNPTWPKSIAKALREQEIE